MFEANPQKGGGAVSKLSSVRLVGAVVLLSLLITSLYICPAMSYAKNELRLQGRPPNGGGGEYYGTESPGDWGRSGGGEDRSLGFSVKPSPQQLLLQIYFACRLLGLSL